MAEFRTEKLKVIHNRIETACKRVGLDLTEVRLLLTTKTVNSDRIKFVLQEGETE